ncbi:Carboxy-terminal processing protease CtpB [termite gut metagenome]|uniref:Carboxy-terminal processing protease CtpB n=1 Tax=termite gut metagenome TaxID=433724 RepID=A0A5J4SP06_9ZZZZ
MSTKKTFQFTPIIIAVSIVFGILIGTFYAKSTFTGTRPGIINSSSGKINTLLHIIDDQYVDTVNINNLVEDAMPQLLAELDPHSTYIPAKRLEEVNSELEGHFSGIGIQFTIQQDTVHVNNVIQGGPSEKVGLMAGDRIITVNDSTFTGKKLNNEIAMRTLKGPKGTHVKLGIKRASEKNILEFDITRGDIPQNSIDAAYMLTHDFGYIQISKFGRTTHVELLNALALLNHEKCKGLIIDLRGNTGGYMDAAIRMVNEFLSEGKLIVYTQGRRSPRSESRANGTGSCQKMPLVVLVDEASASASEIFAGAIQDNDRGTIVGRRSFGKGLVQQPFDFEDRSGIRLTIARYYTPSGRCIQRPYASGKDENYEMDIYTRYEHGEFFSRDSIKLDESLRYSTGLGRPVYGGGGIMPDAFVPQDTTGMTSYLRTVLNKGLILQYAFQYTDKNREILNHYTDEASLLNYLNTQRVIDQFVKYAQSKNVKPRNILIQRSYNLLERSIYGNIIYNVLGKETYIAYVNKSDENVKKALEILNANEAFPKAPATTEESAEKKNDGNKKKRTAQADCGEGAPMLRLYASISVC